MEAVWVLHHTASAVLFYVKHKQRLVSVKEYGEGVYPFYNFPKTRRKRMRCVRGHSLIHTQLDGTGIRVVFHRNHVTHLQESVDSDATYVMFVSGEQIKVAMTLKDLAFTMGWSGSDGN